ncbi:MAG: diguanylate cyclase [Pseudomonadota bacterium]|jgi:diguanylate cyclase
MNRSPTSPETLLAWRQTWQDIRDIAPLATRERVAAVVRRDARELADVFYTAMLADVAVGHLLDHAIVNERLHASMVRWLVQLFDPAPPLDETIAVQQRTGEVHARIGVPADKVASGARTLKRAIARSLAAEHMPPQELTTAVQYVYEHMDIAIDTMNATTSSNATRMTRSDEAYRLFFLTQNLKTERERQKSQLLEWAHQILVRNYWEVRDADDPAAGTDPGRSQFELWLQHKASMLFENSPELAQIHARIATIEHHLLPRLNQARASHEDARHIVGTLNQEIEGIKTTLGLMFEKASELEEGRDGVTRLLNRRYFPAVVKREIALAQSSGSSFALLMLDIDRFDTIGQALGLEAADLVLSQVADALSDSVRAGDFLFRIGDDRFLILMVEAPAASVLSVAHGLRERIARQSLRMHNGTAATLTVSIGTAVHDGHPDYQRLFDRAEAALRQARQAGGNRVVADAASV